MNKLEILREDYSKAVIEFNIFKRLLEIEDDNTEHLTEYQLERFLNLRDWVNQLEFEINEYIVQTTER